MEEVAGRLGSWSRLGLGQRGRDALTGSRGQRGERLHPVERSRGSIGAESRSTPQGVRQRQRLVTGGGLGRGAEAAQSGEDGRRGVISERRQEVAPMRTGDGVLLTTGERQR